MYLLFSPCHVISPIGLSQYLFWFLLVPLEVPAVLTSLISLLWLPRVNTQKKLFQSGSHCFFSPWITFSSSFLLCHPGNDKGRYFPFYILGAEPHVFNSFFPAHDAFLICPLQDMTGCPHYSAGYLEGKIIHSSLGFGDKILRDSISFVFYFVSPDPWSLSPFLLVCPAFKSRSKSSSLLASLLLGI